MSFLSVIHRKCSIHAIKCNLWHKDSRSRWYWSKFCWMSFFYDFVFYLHALPDFYERVTLVWTRLLSTFFFYDTNFFARFPFCSIVKFTFYYPKRQPVAYSGDPSWTCQYQNVKLFVTCRFYVMNMTLCLKDIHILRTESVDIFFILP